MTTVTLDLPTELVDEFGPPEVLATQARRALVLDLLREGRISQGKAATLLGLTRYEILDLMARSPILSGPLSAEEAERDVDVAERGMAATVVNVRG